MVGETDSEVWPARGPAVQCSAWPRTALHLPKDLPTGCLQAQASARSVLKMKRWSVPLTHFCARGLGDAAMPLGQGTASARRSSRVLSVDQSSIR